MGSVNIEVSEETLKELVCDYLREKLGDLDLMIEDVKIEVKSKNNYRSEWELASFRANVHKVI